MWLYVRSVFVRLTPDALLDARSVVGEGTFSDDELHHLYRRFYYASRGTASAITATNFKLYVEKQQIFPAAPKNEFFTFLFLAMSEGASEISWHSFLRYNVAMKFGFSPQEFEAKQQRNETASQAAPSGSVETESPQHSVTIRVGDETKTPRVLLAECYFHMLADQQRGVVTVETCRRVLADAVRWSSDDDSQSAETVTAPFAEALFNQLCGPLQPPPTPAATSAAAMSEAAMPAIQDTRFVTRDDFVATFVSDDAIAYRLVSAL